MPSWQLAFRSIRRVVGILTVASAVALSSVAVPASAATLKPHTTSVAETMVLLDYGQMGSQNQWALGDYVSFDSSQSPNWNSYNMRFFYRCTSTPDDPTTSSDCTIITTQGSGINLTDAESGTYIVIAGITFDEASGSTVPTVERSNYSPLIGTLAKPCIQYGTVCDLTLTIEGWGSNVLTWGPIESPQFSGMPVSGYQVASYSIMNPNAETVVCEITDPSVHTCTIPFKMITPWQNTPTYYVVRPVVTGSPYPMPGARIAVQTPQQPGIGARINPNGVLIGANPSYMTFGGAMKTEYSINGKTCTYTWLYNNYSYVPPGWAGDCASLPSTWGMHEYGALDAAMGTIFNLTPGATYALTGTTTYAYVTAVGYSNYGLDTPRVYSSVLPINAKVTTPTDWPAAPQNVTFSKNSDGTYHVEWTYTGPSGSWPSFAAMDSNGNEQSGSCTGDPAVTGTQYSCDVDFYAPADVQATWGTLSNMIIAINQDLTTSTLSDIVAPTEAQSIYWNQSWWASMQNGPGWLGFYISSWGDANGAYSGSNSSGGGGSSTTAPGAPTGVTASAGNGQATVTWTAPSSTGGASITGYTVQYSSDGGSTWTTASCTGTSTSCTITGLTNGSNYVFKVAATNSAGTGSYSSNSSSVSPASGTTAPGAPTGVTASAGNGQATVTWTAPSSTGGASITGYTVQYSSDGGSTWTTSSCTGTSTSCTITGLTNGTSYKFKVAATNSAGTGSYSSNSSSVSPSAPSAPGAPTLGATTSTDTSVTVNWTAPSNNGGSSITGYTVQVKDGSGNVIGTCTTTGTSCTVSPLTPGTTYTVSLVATNALGQSTAATKSILTTNTAGKKAKRFYIRRYAKGQLSVKAKQIKLIKKAVTSIVKSGATTIRITGWTNTGAAKIKSTKRAVNVAKVVNKQLATLHATHIQVTTVGGGGTKKFGGTVLNRVTVIRGK